MQNLMTWEGWVVWLLAAAAVPAVSAYFGAYFRRSGENRAMSENLDNLVREVKAVTKTTEEIKAEISNEVWNRQRQWEFKRDVLFEVAKRLGAYREAFSDVVIAFMAEGESDGLEQNRIDCLSVWNRVATEYTTSTRVLIDLVCGAQTRAVFIEFGKVTRGGARDATAGKRELLKGWAEESTRKYRAACDALRRELGIDVPVEGPD